MSTDRTSDENNSGQRPVADNPDGARMYFIGAARRTENQSHDEGSSYGSDHWRSPDSHPSVESISSDADPSPLCTASTHDASTQPSRSPLASSKEDGAMGGHEAHMAPAASSGYGALQFARPEPGFDPADDQFVKQFHTLEGSTRHVLGHLRQSGPTMKESYLQSIEDLRRATGRVPNEQEKAFIEKTLRKNTGWLEGYKATLEGQTTVPMAAFNRLAQDYEDTILYVARDRAAYEADAMVSILSRDDQIGALRRELGAVRPQEATPREKDLETQLNALNEEVEKLRPQSSRCISLEAEMAELKEQTERRVRAAMVATEVATERAMRRAYDQHIKTLEEQLEACEARRERYSLKKTSLDALADEVAELRQQNAKLRNIVAVYEGPEKRGTSNAAHHGNQEEYDGEDGTAPSEVGPRAKDSGEAPADAALQSEAAQDTKRPSPGYLVLKNAFVDSQRLRVAKKEVEILRADLERAEENERALRANNVNLAARLNRNLGRLALRDDEISLLRVQIAEAEKRASRTLAAVRGQGHAGTVDEELIQQWRDATARNNKMILTELADEEEMLATFKNDMQKLLQDYQNGQLPDEVEHSYDKPVPL